MARVTANDDDEEEYDVEKMMAMIMLIMVSKLYKFKWWRHIGSPSQFGDGDILFSCWDWFQ